MSQFDFCYFCPNLNTNTMYPDENIICNCMNVSEHEILDAIKNKGARTVDDIQEITGAGTSCGSCIFEIEEILERERNK